jgi:hypothetical protein
MRLRKVVNRVYEGKTYYRWLISISPKHVRDLGWVDGQALEATVRDSTLTLVPSVRARPGRRTRRGQQLEDAIQLKSAGRW